MKENVLRGGVQRARLLLVVVSVALLGILGGSTVLAQGGTTAAVGLPTNQIIIQYKTDATAPRAAASSQAQMDRLSAAAGVELTYFREMSGDAHVLMLPGRLPLAEVELAAARLETLPEVEYAEPDRIMLPFDDPAPQSPALVPNDPQYGSQWHYSAPVAGSYGANLPAGWDITNGSPSLTIAVLDTGSLFGHPDLAGRFTTTDYDMISDSFVGNDGNARDNDPSDPGDWVAAFECGFNAPSDSSWHGTHVAGTIGAKTNNSVGVSGINWSSPIQTVRVLGKCGGVLSDVADGIRWAAGLAVPGVPNNTQPSRVMNLSLGGVGPCGTTFQNAINAALAQNVVVVVAAGNSSVDASGFAPANCNGVITVAATNRNGGRAWYSNFGSVVEIAAPGGDTSSSDSNGVLSTLNDGATTPGNHTYQFYQGTSMAAPHVTGIVSLMLSLNPSLTPAQVLSFLQSNVTPFPNGSDCNTSNCGAGIVNAGAVLNAIGPGAAGPVTVTSVRVQDENKQDATEFHRGDEIRFKIKLHNDGTLACNISLKLKVKKDTTVLFNESKNVNVDPGNKTVKFKENIPNDAPFLQYTAKATSNCNGQKDSGKDKFSVVP